MTIDLPLGAIWALPLASVRIFAMFSTAPIFGHETVPLRVRVSFGFLFAVVAAPLAEAPAIDAEISTWILAGMVASETLIGATLGFALRLIFMVFAPLGELISVQGGLGAASVLDPASGVSSPVIGVLLQAFAVVVFFAVDGHHALLRGLAASFEWMPLGTGSLSPDHLGAVVGLGASLFEITARLALPVTVMMLVANVGVGILGRAITQLNLMALQLPAHIAMVLILLILAAAPLTDVIATTLSNHTAQALAIISGGS